VIGAKETCCANLPHVLPLFERVLLLLPLLERDAALARVTELEAPGECASIHKLRAQVADLQAVVERVRPVVDELAAAWDCGSPMMIRHLMERLGRAAYTSRVEDAAWLRSLLSTAPDPVHRPGHTDLMVAPESVPDLAPQPPPTPGEADDLGFTATPARYAAHGRETIDRMHDLKDIREALANQAVVRAVSAILIEHQRAVRKWPEWPTDTTHAAAILAGEGGECLKAANHHREGRLTEGKDSLFMVGVEATQAGAMAVRLLSNHPRKVEQ